MEKLYRDEKNLVKRHEGDEHEDDEFAPIRAPGKCAPTHKSRATHYPGVPGKVALTSRLPLVQRESVAARPSMDHDMLEVVHHALEIASRSSGHPLPGPLQSELEQLTRTDLSAVRIHTDAAADRAANALDARAFTTGQDIYFAAGAYDPRGERGRRLVAHEVAHTIQQRGLSASGTGTASVSSPGEPLERQADEFGGLFSASTTTQVAPAPTRRPPRLDAAPAPQVQRQDLGGDREVAGDTAEDAPGDTTEDSTEEAPQETYVTHELIGYELRGDATLADFPAHIRRMVRGGATGRRLRQVTREHEEAGHRIIRQVRSHEDKQIVMHYAAIPHSEPTLSEENLSINGVTIPVRGATRAELADVRQALSYVPGPHLQEFLRRRHRIVIVDWSGSQSESTPSHRLTGGTNMERSITREQRPNQTAEVEEGERIEITHTALTQDNGGITTILHEMGHVVYDAGLIPRSVSRRYGTSVHNGPNAHSEQPAYGYMYYVWQPDRLAPTDRRAFDAEFRRQGLPPSGSGTASEDSEQSEEPEQG